MEKSSETVKVCIRVRPMNSKEKNEGQDEIVSANESRNELMMQHIDGGNKPLQFTFDYVFGQQCTQKQVYDACSRSVINSLLAGFNCTIFAYGQTGSGKTFTMEGVEGNPELVGIIPRSFRQIFDVIRASDSNTDHLVRASMIELYNEEIRDSLSKNERKEKLEIHQDPKTGFYVRNISIINVKNEDELLALVSFGKSSRQVRATSMNDYSSRSHSILTVFVESSQGDPSSQEKAFRIGKLNLVDLAGSEKQKQTNTTDEGLKEGININLSLTTLGNVINLLVKGASHIPYRNSKLTKLLSDSLGGNNKTLMIANVSPSAGNFQESLQTLKYASRAKLITNKPVVNEDPKDALLRQKQEELKLLRNQIEQMAIGKTPQTNTNLTQQATSTNVDKKAKEENINLGPDYHQECNDLQRQVIEAQEKLQKEEVEKQKLLIKYDSMCRDIISKHEYENDLTVAREELEKLRSDKTEKQNYLQSQKLLKAKKQEVDSIDAKSKQASEHIISYNQRISKMREEIVFFKQNKQSAALSLNSQVNELAQDIQQKKLYLKKQQFILQQLVPVWFQKNFDNEFNNIDDCKKAAFTPFSVYELRKPTSSSQYDISLSYKNPYIREIQPKPKKFPYPEAHVLYDDGFIIRIK